MLSHLAIRDVVLIDRLDLEFRAGLSVLTGETGAGKSILLDALGLATGARADVRLVRRGAERASVSAVFDVPDGDPIRAQLAEHGIETAGEPLIVRRVLNADGRSRAFVNDQAVSIGLLGGIGAQLVEVHGQFDSQKLMRPDSHRPILDAFGDYSPLLSDVAEAHGLWREARRRREAAAAEAAAARRDEEFLRFAVKELEELAPQPGEETELAEQRKIMMNGEKLGEALGAAQGNFAGESGAETRLRDGLRALERARAVAGTRLDEAVAGFERGLNEVAEGMALLDRLSGELIVDPAELETTEERLFALRAMARKHQVEVDALADLKADFERRLLSVEDGAAHIEELERAETRAWRDYQELAERLSAERIKSAGAIDKAVGSELTALKLEKARFETSVTTGDEDSRGAHGMDRVQFLAATNPDAEPGPINKIASGGELARFMLALKAVLAAADAVPTLVFDEADAGVGGAAAAAVGRRLAKLGEACQVLVVTHSPQVAAMGAWHLRVSKSETANDEAPDGRVWTTVEPLDAAARKEEIARMLAGAEITDEARAAADRLLAGGSS